MFKFLHPKPQSEDDTRQIFAGFFGKVALSDELLNYQLKSSEIYEFERRLFDCIKTLEKRKQQGIGSSLERLPLISFLFSGQNPNSASTGVMFASKDQNNNPYPFVIFNAIRQAEIQNQLAILPYLQQEFLQKAGELASMDWSSQSIENLMLSIDSLPGQRFDFTKAALLQAQIDLLSQTPIATFWAAMADFQDSRSQAFYLSAFYALVNMIATKRIAKSVSAIKLPLPDTSNQLPYVVFLTQILAHCLHGKIEQSRFFWYRGNDHYQSSLIYFFRPLSVAGLMQVLDRTVNENAILDIKTTIDSLTDPTRQAVSIVHQTDSNLMEQVFRWTQLVCPEQA